MSPHLPESVDPWRSADLQRCFSGQLTLDMFPRLGRGLTSSNGVVDYSLKFSNGARRRATINGTLSARLMIECQRCMKPMQYPLEVTFKLVVTAGAEEAKKLPDEVDSLVVEDERINLLEIIEDEMILALPFVAMHRADECGVRPDDLAIDDEIVPEQEDSEEKNPFAVLAQLKSNSKQTD